MHLVPESSAKGHFNVLRGYVKPLGVAGVKVVSDFVDNYKLGPALGDGAAQPVRSGDRHAARRDRRDGDHRHAHRRDDRDRRQASRAQGQPRPRPHRRARHGVLERAAARPPVRLRRDPRAFAAAREPRRFRRAPVARPRQAGEGHRRLGVVRARRGHRRRSLAPAGACAAAQDRVDQARARSSFPTAR